MENKVYNDIRLKTLPGTKSGKLEDLLKIGSKGLKKPVQTNDSFLKSRESMTKVSRPIDQIKLKTLPGTSSGSLSELIKKGARSINKKQREYF